MQRQRHGKDVQVLAQEHTCVVAYEGDLFDDDQRGDACGCDARSKQPCAKHEHECIRGEEQQKRESAKRM